MRTALIASPALYVGLAYMVGVKAYPVDNPLLQPFLVNVLGPILYGTIDLLVSVLLALGFAFDC